MYAGITGASGTLGKIIQSKLTTMGDQFSVFTGDILNQNEVREWLNSKSFDTIFHFAAVVPTTEVQSRPAYAFQVNVNGVAIILECLANLQMKPWFFYASSSHVYQSQSHAIRETDVIAPINVYGLTKRMGEQIVETCAPAAEIEFCIGRIFSFFHKFQIGSFLYPMLLKRFATEDLSKPFKLMGATDVRDITLADTIVDYIIQLAQFRAKGIINIGSGVGTRIDEFVQLVAPQPIHIVNSTNTPPTTLIADISRLKEFLKRHL